MATVVKMPQLGESVVEGTVSRWLKAPGDRVAKREPLLEIATDKIDTEVPAPADGILLEILVAAGVTVKAGVALATIGAAGEQARGEGRGATAANRRCHELRSLPLNAVTPHLSRLARHPSPLAAPSGRSFVSPVWRGWRPSMAWIWRGCPAPG